MENLEKRVIQQNWEQLVAPAQIEVPKGQKLLVAPEFSPMEKLKIQIDAFNNRRKI